MSLRAIGTLLCGAVALGAIQAGTTTPAKADKQDLILQRLDALEKENRALKNRLQRIEGTGPARTSGAPVVSTAPAPQGPQGAMASAPPAGAVSAKAPVAFTCDRYGPGFYGIPGVPGMSGCLKIGGYIRAQGAWGASGDGTVTGADAMAPQGVQTRLGFNDSNYQARAAISLDARLPTAWGDVRGYARFGAEINTPFGSTFPVGVGNGPLVNLPNAPVIFWDRGYIQYVGATIGKARSFFDLFALTDGYLTYGNPRASGDTNLTGVVLAGYTAKFGDGFSASVSVEDPNGHNKIGPINFALGGWGLGTISTNQLGGQGLNQRGYSVPDIIGNLRVDQSWGYAGITGAIHQVAASYYSGGAPAPCGGGGNEACDNPSNRYGWAISGGGQVIIPGTLRDTFGANVVYSEGAVGFATRGALWQLYRSNSSAGFGWANDGIYDNTTPGCVGLNCRTNILLTQAWSINAAYEHVWSPEWKTSAYGSYAAINYNQTATNIINSHLPGAAGSVICGVPVAGAVLPPLGIPVGGGGNSCSPNYSFWTVGSRTQYSPVAWLDLGVDVFYTHFNSAYKGTNVTLAQNNGRLAGPYTIEDQSVLTVLARAQLNFNP